MSLKSKTIFAFKVWSSASQHNYTQYKSYYYNFTHFSSLKHSRCLVNDEDHSFAGQNHKLCLKKNNLFLLLLLILACCLQTFVYLVISINRDWTQGSYAISLIFMQWILMRRMAESRCFGNTSTYYSAHPVKYERTKYFYSSAIVRLHCVFI